MEEGMGYKSRETTEKQRVTIRRRAKSKEKGRREGAATLLVETTLGGPRTPV